jgi:hypothetical protein
MIQVLLLAAAERSEIAASTRYVSCCLHVYVEDPKAPEHSIEGGPSDDITVLAMTSAELHL